MPRADKPIEADDNILDPITVKAEDADEMDRDDAAEDQETEPTPLGSEEREAPQAARPTTERQSGEAPQRKPPREKPSSWKGLINKLVTEKTSAYEKTIGELRQTIAQLQGSMQTFQQFAPRQQQQDPTANEMQSIAKELQDLSKMAANPELTPEQRQSIAERYAALDDKRLELRASAIAERKIEERLKQFQEQAPTPEYNAAVTVIASEFPRINADPSAKAAARAYYNYLVAENGGVESLDILREACQYVYTKRGWASQTYRPSARERGQFETAPGNGRGNGQSGGDITFTPEDLRVMRGAPVSPEEVAAQARLMMKRGY